MEREERMDIIVEKMKQLCIQLQEEFLLSDVVILASEQCIDDQRESYNIGYKAKSGNVYTCIGLCEWYSQTECADFT